MRGAKFELYCRKCQYMLYVIKLLSKSVVYNAVTCRLYLIFENLHQMDWGEKMKHIGLLDNVVQEYAWGSLTAIPKLLGTKVPSEKPQAELWMGAHPKAPSLVNTGNDSIPMDKLIDMYAEDILGKSIAGKFSNKLPYLFKVLAAGKPLSIQAHPSKVQAEQGFKRENKLGIPLDAGNRNYKDDNHKPECICALTNFWGLCGFRNIPDMLLLFQKIMPTGLAKIVDDFKQQPDSSGLKTFFGKLLTIPDDLRDSVVKEAVDKAMYMAKEEPVFQWMITLNNEYGNDIGIFSPVLLNLICLKPGQAIFLNAGEFHAYLDGVGIELMANSDNVLRGGLTPKHMDENELLRVLNFEPGEPEIILPIKSGDCEQIYHSKAAEFVLSVIDVKNELTYASSENRGPEIVLCVKGKLTITETAEMKNTLLSKGKSAIIPASVSKYSIQGNGVLYKASVPV